MRLLVLTLALGALAAPVSALASPGDLDPAFSTDGRVRTPIGSGNSDATAVAVQPDGKIVVAGYSSNGTDDDFAVVRYEADGDPDTTFGGGDGIVVTPVGTGGDQAWTIALQPDGKILVAGYSSNGTDDDFALVRYESDGDLDPTFGGTDGIVTTPIGTGLDQGWALALQSNGAIVVVGATGTGAASDFALVRYESDGDPDATFGGGDGIVTTAVGGGEDVAYGVQLQPGGEIVVVGYASNGTNDDFAVARYESGGDPDPSFGGGDGKVLTPIGSGQDQAIGVALGSDGKIVAVGAVGSLPNRDFGLARYEADGDLDSTFSGDGLFTTDVSAGADAAAVAVALDSEERIVVAGAVNLGNDDVAVLRLNPDGTPDAGFDDDGVATTGMGPSADYGWAVAVQSDDKIVVAGPAMSGASIYEFGVARFLGVDTDAPANPAFGSMSHPAFAWSSDPTVDVFFGGAVDDSSGVDGFSLLWDANPATVPDTVKDAEESSTLATSPPFADGQPYYLHLRTVDSAGNWSAAAHAGPFQIDATAPGAGTATAARFQPAAAFPLTWQASDATSGAVSYDVRYRRAGYRSGFGPFTSWRAAATTSSGVFSALPGSTYCFSTRATDGAANVGAFGAERCTTVPVDERRMAYRGSWTKRRASGYYLGTFSRATRPGAALTLRVAAKRLTLVATKCRRCGAVEVFLGAKRLKRISLTSTVRRQRQFIPIATFARVRKGTVTVRVVSSGRPVLIEGLGVSRL